MERETTIKNIALKNAIEFKGKAREKAVLGNMLATYPEIKKEMAQLTKQVIAIVQEVNNMSVEEQSALLQKSAPELLEKEKGEKRQLLTLPNAEKGKVVTRIPPEPSKYLHIGHALSFLINIAYTEKYEGKCIVRFEDTNPSLAKQEFVDAMIKDLEWLGITSKPNFVSDDMEKLYAHAEHLIEKGLAYACLCPWESMQEKRRKGVCCDCRENPPGENMLQWNTMLEKKYKEGEAVLRLRGDMDAENAVMRDPALFRINFTKHYRQGEKYVVWPLYDFENAVEDSENKVTHILRSIEFGSMRIELQKKIKQLLGLSMQEIIQYGRFKINNATTQGREIREMIEAGELQGWDDPRLVTISALRRRGIQTDALKELAIEVGLSLNTTVLDWKRIATKNRKHIDAKSARYVLLVNPEEVKIEKMPTINTTRKLHPDWSEEKKITYVVEEAVLVEKEDKEKLNGDQIVRLMECCNVKKNTYHSDSITAFKEQGGKQIILWLPTKETTEITILMQDATIQKAWTENAIEKLSIGAVVQFMRFGFCRYEGDKTFIFAHE